MSALKKHKFSSFDMYIFIILIAFELLMSFTFLGYIHIPPVSVTLAYIPILIAACLLGTVQSTVVGAVFGLASMYKSTSFYVLPADMLFSPFLSGNPIGSLILSVGTRTLFGFLIGLAFSWAKKSKRPKLWIGVVSLIAPTFHAFLVLTASGIFFPDELGEFVSPFLIISNIILSIFCVGIVEFSWREYTEKSLKTVKSAIDKSSCIPNVNSSKQRFLISLFTVFIFGMTIAAALYFADRMSFMLRQHNVAVSAVITGDLIHLQVQFMMALFSLNVISVVILILGYQYTAYRSFLGELDAVTNVMGRRLFLNCCERAQHDADLQSCREGWFLFLDVDNFKSVNDTLGHTVGDSVLKKVAFILKNTFYDYGIIGRMGGDEFAVMIDKKEVGDEEIKKLTDGFLSEISGIIDAPLKVSCSIGACRFSFPADIAVLMNKTDTFLYRAKENGRACCVIGSMSE